MISRENLTFLSDGLSIDDVERGFGMGHAVAHYPAAPYGLEFFLRWAFLPWSFLPGWTRRRTTDKEILFEALPLDWSA